MTPPDTVKPTAWKRVVLRATAIVLALISALLVVEVGFRLVRPTPWYERVGAPQSFGQQRVHSVGRFQGALRAALPDAPKTDETLRILFLGDSFTYGQGVEDEASVFPGRIATRLNRERPLPGKRTYQVFNGGIPGSAPGRWVQLYEEAAPGFQPDWVVVVFFMRNGTADVGSIRLVSDIREGMNDLVRKSFLFRHSYTYRFFRERRAQAGFSKIYLREMNEAYLGDDRARRPWRDAQRRVLEIRDRCRERGTGFALVIFPMLYGLDEDHPLSGAVAEIERFCREAGLPCLSLLPAFIGRDAPSLWVSALDQHPNAAGHAIAADAIYPFLVEQMRSGR